MTFLSDKRKGGGQKLLKRGTEDEIVGAAKREGY